MIKIEELTCHDVGYWVEYLPKKELGRIKSWNDKSIFVVYKCSNNWDRFKNYTGCATNPKDLIFVSTRR